MHRVSGFLFIMVKKAVKHSTKRKEKKKKEKESDIVHVVENFTRIPEDSCVLWSGEE